MPAPQRRQRGRRGAAWYWKQTDAWYYTPCGTKRRVPLFDEDGYRIRGAEKKSLASLALARAKLATDWRPEALAAQTLEPVVPWLVARVCSQFIQHAEQRVKRGDMAREYALDIKRYFNQLCEFCGALPVSELKKGHVQLWIEQHPQWSAVTRRNVITIVLAAFNHAQREFGIRNPLKGLKKPPAQPRLQSFSPEEEQSLYNATDRPFREFLFAAIHTGLRPFCELARLTAADVEETPRGMMWRVFSSKTRKTRKIPISPQVAALTRQLLKSAPRGSGKTIFRNAQGNGWKKVTCVSRFLVIKRKLGWDQDSTRKKFSTYTCRHTFAHRMLSGYWNNGAGCAIEVLAELLGNTPKVAYDHYGRQWGRQYQEPLWAAVGLPAESGGHRSTRTTRR